MTMQIIGWAIVHSLWQGGLIALVATALFSVTRQSNASTRYAIGIAGLALMAILPIATAMRGVSTPVSSRMDSSAPTTRLAGNTSPAASASPSASATPTASNDSRSPSATVSESSSIISDVRRNTRSVARTVTDTVEPALPWLVVAWVIGLLLASAQLIGGLIRTRRVTRNGASAARSSLEKRVQDLSERLGIAGGIKVLESVRIDVPLVVGTLRPIIVVPVSLVTGLSPMQLDMLLAHELAHVRRYDFFVNLLQTVVETLLFYHPGVRWLSDRVRDERENCCDDVALAICNGDAAEYTETLLTLEESRAHSYGLAAAATGGSLLRRAQRLLTGTTPHVELGPRWIAGIVTISAALFAGREAMGSGVQASFTPSALVDMREDSTDKRAERGDRPDMSRAAPASVTRAPLGGSLADKWRWAEQQSRGSGTYWVGYVIAGDPDNKSRYYASDFPVRIDGNTTMTGRMHLGDGDLSGFTFYGVPLAPLVGRHSPRSTAVFFELGNGALGRRVQRVHIGTFELPVYFDRRPVMWLDSASDAESISIIRSLLSRARNDETRRDIVAAAGVHQRSDVVVPMLVDILESRDAEGSRREAAQWLGRKVDPRVMPVLSRAARGDRSKVVREEAVEAFGHMKTPAATDSLISFASSFRDQELRRTTIEALGHRADDRAVAYLTRVARSDDDQQVRREAVETLGDMPGGRGFAAVIDIARTDPDTEIRREAVETIGHSRPTSRALEILQQIIRNDRDESVRAEAVETIAEVHDSRSVDILRDIANNDPSTRVQVEAVESLAETVDRGRALGVLRSIARSHRSPEVRRKALEALGEYRDNRSAVDALMDAARTDSYSDVRTAALETLADSPDPAVLRQIEALVKGRESLALRLEALHAYAEHAPTLQALGLLKSMISSGESLEMRLRALELLEDLEDDAGIPTLRDLARGHSDARIKERAAEILRDR